MEPPNGSRFRTRQRGCSPPSAISRPVSPRAEEIESRRRVPGDIVEALRRVGVFRMLAPHSHGGLALSVPAAVPVLEALSAADSSASWVTMIAVTSHTFCTRLPRATYDRLRTILSAAIERRSGRRVTGGARSTERLTACPTSREPSGQRLDPRGLSPASSAPAIRWSLDLPRVGRRRTRRRWPSGDLRDIHGRAGNTVFAQE